MIPRAVMPREGPGSVGCGRMGAPLHPDVVVDLRGQLAKPVACLAMVRRALQKAGHGDDAVRFTNEAFASSNEELVEVASRFVTVVVDESSSS